MEKELSLLEEQFRGYDSIRFILSGIGKVNAAVAAGDIASEWSPDCLLSVGCAGSFADDAAEGDVIIGSATAYHDCWCGGISSNGYIPGLPERFPADPELLAEAVKAAPTARQGLIITGDQFYYGPQEDARQKKMYPDALAVDMEAAAVAHFCHRKTIPFLAIKVISDTHNDGKQAEHYSDFWKEMAPEAFRKAAEIIKSLL